MNYIVVDIETVPVDYETYKTLDEEEKNKYFNPNKLKN